MYLIEHGTRAAEMASGLNGGVDDSSLHVRDSGLSRVPLDLNIPKPVICKPRLVDLLFPVTSYVCVRGPCVSQRPRVYQAVFAHEFGVPQGYLRSAGSPADSQPGPACEVLPHVKDIYPGARAAHRHRVNRPGHLHARHQLRVEYAAGFFHLRGA